MRSRFFQEDLPRCSERLVLNGCKGESIFESFG
jgi:hypothetical protein